MADTEEKLATLFGFPIHISNAIGKMFIFNICAIVTCYVVLFTAVLRSGLIVMIPLTAAGLAVQFILGLSALFKQGSRLVGITAMVAAPAMGMAAILPLAMVGGGWGRPLRIKGKQLHPELCEGTDWTRGARPDISGLDEDTRKALAALWLHDAQKEHASVPAFSRISWLLAAIGAPAELMEWSHRAALEEIAHTRICFALAAGYGGTSYSVEPMPDLLIGALEIKEDPVLVLAKESLEDGCQLEDFNADVAAACAEGCEEPATRAVLEQIAREERLHADFSWALLEWLYARWPAKVKPEMERALRDFDKIQRPTAVSWQKMPLVAKADPVLMRRHGRLPDESWGALWEVRIAENRKRLGALLEQGPGKALAA